MQSIGLFALLSVISYSLGFITISGGIGLIASLLFVLFFYSDFVLLFSLSLISFIVSHYFFDSLSYFLRIGISFSFTYIISSLALSLIPFTLALISGIFRRN